MKLRDLLSAKGSAVETVAPTATIAEVCERLARLRIGALVVVDGAGPPAGIVSERDVVRVLAERGAAGLAAEVREVMSSPVTSRTPDDDVVGLMALMTERRIRHVPVLDGSGLVGIVSIGDVVKSRLEELERDRKELLEYVSAR